MLWDISSDYLLKVGPPQKKNSVNEFPGPLYRVSNMNWDIFVLCVIFCNCMYNVHTNSFLKTKSNGETFLIKLLTKKVLDAVLCTNFEFAGLKYHHSIQYCNMRTKKLNKDYFNVKALSFDSFIFD